MNSIRTRTIETLRLAGSRETMTEVGDAIENIVQYRLPDDYYSTYASKVRALTTNDLTTAGKSFLNRTIGLGRGSGTLQRWRPEFAS